MSDVPDVPGFVVTSGAGDVVPDARGLTHWPAVQEETRRRVALVPLPAMSPAQREAVSGVLARYADVVDEHLSEPPHLAEHADVLVVPAAAYVTLDRLMPAVRPSSAGQVVTVLAPVSSAVAALASHGLSHGAVGEGVVSIDADGRPGLMQAGMLAALHALRPDEWSEPTPQADREAVMGLLSAMADAVGDEQLDALVRRLVTEQAGPGEVAERLLAAFDPVPLGQDVAAPGSAGDDTPPAQATARSGGTTADGGEGATEGARRRGSRRSLVRRIALVALTMAALVVVGVIWLSSPGEDDAAVAGAGRTDLPAPSEPNAVVPGTAASESPAAGATGAASDSSDEAASSLGTDLCGAPPPPPDEPPDLAENWVDVVDALNTRRSAALVTGQTSLLCEVYDPSSPALVSDLELDAAYTERGVRPDSLVFVVEQATLVEQDGALLVLEITDRLEPYSLVAQDGRVVAELPGIGSETWQARLVPDTTGTSWRFA